MKRFLKLLTAFALVFVLSLYSVRAQEEPTEPTEPVVSHVVETAPVVSIRGHNNSLILSWNAVENATKYVIQRSAYQTKGFKTIATVKTTSYQNKSLKYGSAYYYRVVAYGPENHKTSAVVGRKVVPNKVVNVKLTPYSNQIRLSWNKTSNHGYLIYRSLDGKKWTKIATITKNSTLAYMNKKLASNRVYYYQIKAYQKVGRKIVAGPSSGVFSIRTAPAAPAVAAGYLGIDEIKLKVKAVSGATKYQIYSYNERTKKWEFEEYMYPYWFENNYALDYFYVEKPYHTYYYRVRACSDTVCGSFTTVKAQGKLTPGNIEVLRGENKAVNIYIRETYGAYGYQIYRATSLKGTYTKVGALSGTSNTVFRDKSVAANKTYYYKVRSFMKIGKNVYYSAFSPVRVVKTGTNAGYLSAYDDAKRLAKGEFMSRQALINTLVLGYNYSESDAAKGVDKCGFDFNYNALRTAQDYVMYSSAIEANALKKLLVNELLFTEEEATYAVENMNLNWHDDLTRSISYDLEYGDGYGRGHFIEAYANEELGFTEEQVNQILTELNPNYNAQAVKRLNATIDWYEIVSRGEAVRELQSQGFTQEEIEYAFANVEYDWQAQLVTYYNYIENPYDGKQYLSKAKVIEILTSESYGYTEQEIVDMLDSLDIDFNEYALAKANSMLGFEYLSEAAVESRLVDCLFTGEEIEYALANVETDFNFNAYILIIDKIDEDARGSRDSLGTYLDMLRFTEDNITYAFSQIPTSKWIELATTEINAYVDWYNHEYNSGLPKTSVQTIMIDQFKFTSEEVTAALQYVTVDFAEQALLSAKEFVSKGIYSRESLTLLLTNSGYTETEANFAASSSEIDYGEECAEYITEHYIGQENIGSLDNIVQDLLGYGFTQAEIDYAVEKTNLESYL